ncbi:proton-conducting transporter membrane subunit [Agarilytica rhodophyticola]|uniref:proton-conducting transporter transmembrane domain-containing protein n=1 Tax=Agarilytica rhodophyticola TaxID=1737490 RepID=UPI000B347945|nr:proton-conducting transporter membrane subunit [Agarilytica rhodophyticola]
MSSELLLLLSLFLPLVAAFLIALTGKSPNVRESVTLVASVLLLVVVTALYRRFLAGEVIAYEWLQILPGLAIKFRLESLGVLFSLVASFLWVITSVYGIGYMRGNNEKNQTRFFMLFPVAIAAALAIAFAGNLLTLFIFYEVMTLSTFPLVTHKGNDNAVKSGRIYLGVLIGSSIGLLLPAIIWVWSITGTTDFIAGGILLGKLDGTLLTVLALLFVLGIGKAAVMPVHRWLPAAMVAPTPVSALLHAVAVVKAGVFSVVKVVVYIFGIDHLRSAPHIEWVLYLAFFTVVMSSVIALRQDNLKKRLAYSTISQLSYVVMAALLLAPISIVGAAMHIAAHAFGKITLFFAAGSIYTASKKTEISQLDGIGHRMPFTMVAFTIGALSMIGLPPAVGFISKWYILMGAFEAEQMLAVGVILLSTLLNTAYFIPIVYRAFFVNEAGDNKDHGEAPVAIVAALSMTALLTMVLFLYPEIPYNLASMIQVR